MDIFQYASDIAANQPGSALGPQKIKKATTSHEKLKNLHWHSPIVPCHPHEKLDALIEVSQMCELLAKQTYQAMMNQQPFLTLGGDHSCAIGTWSGVASALIEKGDIGLIWFDAHLDAHTPESSPSKNIHGMPLAALLGYGPAELTDIFLPHRKLKASNLVLIGIRSFEKGEYELLTSLNCRIYFMDEIVKRGLEAITNEAIEIVSANTAGFGVSIDVDAVDPQQAPGVSTAEKNGIRAQDLLMALTKISEQAKLVGGEIAEFNPLHDINDQTLNVISEMIAIFCQR